MNKKLHPMKQAAGRQKDGGPGNSPKVAMSPAQRQRRYRTSKKLSSVDVSMRTIELLHVLRSALAIRNDTLIGRGLTELAECGARDQPDEAFFRQATYALGCLAGKVQNEELGSLRSTLSRTSIAQERKDLPNDHPVTTTKLSKVFLTVETMNLLKGARRNLRLSNDRTIAFGLLSLAIHEGCQLSDPVAPSDGDPRLQRLASVAVSETIAAQIPAIETPAALDDIPGDPNIPLTPNLDTGVVTPPAPPESAAPDSRGAEPVSIIIDRERIELPRFKAGGLDQDQTYQLKRRGKGKQTQLQDQLEFDLGAPSNGSHYPR